MDAASSGGDLEIALVSLFGCFLMIALPIIFIFLLVMAIVRKSRGWTIGAIIAGIVTVAGIVALIGYASKRTAMEIKERELPKEFVSADKLVKVTADGHWRELELGSEDASLQIGNLFQERYLMVLSELKIDFEEGFTLENYRKVILEQMEEIVQGAEFAEAQPMMIGGKQAIRTDLEGEIDGTGLAYAVFFIEGVDHFHQILTWTLRDRKDEIIPELVRVAETFEEQANPAQ